MAPAKEWATESDLVAAARRGNRVAAERLCTQHLPAVWRAAYAVCGRRGLADEAVQDCFERVLSNLHRFETGRPFAPWVHRIAVNCATDLLRNQRHHAQLDDQHPASFADEPAVEDREALVSALAPLSIEHRTVVVLRVLLGHPPEDVAKMLGVRVGTVHSRLSRALDQLRGSVVVVDE